MPSITNTSSSSKTPDSGLLQLLLQERGENGSREERERELELELEAELELKYLIINGDTAVFWLFTFTIFELLFLLL